MPVSLMVKRTADNRLTPVRFWYWQPILMVNIDKVAELCAAYEMGHNASQLGLATSYNEFAEDSENYYAWMLGHYVGGSKDLLNTEKQFRPN